MPPNPRTGGPGDMEIDRGVVGASGEGLRTYYITKIEELMLTVNDKRQDTRRLQVLIKFNYLCFQGKMAIILLIDKYIKKHEV